MVDENNAINLTANEVMTLQSDGYIYRTIPGEDVLRGGRMYTPIGTPLEIQYERFKSIYKITLATGTYKQTTEI